MARYRRRVAPFAGKLVRGAVAADPFTRTTTGLLFEDDFQRANSEVVGNGWTEYEGAGSELQILDNELKLTFGANLYCVRESGPTLPNDYICQVNFRVAGAASYGLYLGGTSVGTDDANSSYYRPLPNATLNRARIFRTKAGASIQLGGNITVTQSATNAFAVRMVMLKVGADRRVRNYLTLLSSITDIATTPVERHNQLDTDIPVDGDEMAIVTFAGTQFARKFFYCGRNVGFAGLPTGWKARIDSDVLVEESSGIVTVDVDARALPGAKVEITDAADVVQETITEDIWGGAIYTYVA